MVVYNRSLADILIVELCYSFPLPPIFVGTVRVDFSAVYILVGNLVV